MIRLPKHSSPSVAAPPPGAVSNNLGAVKAPRSFSFMCSMPPSANSIWRAVNGRVIKSAEYREWVQDAGLSLAREVWPQQQSGLIPFNTAPVEVSISFPKGHASSDLDNRIKPTLDLLQAAGILRNDNIVHEIRARWRSKTYADQERVWVTVSEMT